MTSSTQSIPTLECHICGYDMHGCEQNDLCPECGTAFSTLPDAYASKFQCAYPNVLAVLGMIAMPFMAALSVMLFISPILFFMGNRSKFPGVRMPTWAARAVRLNQILIYTALAEFWMLMILHSVWPNLLNWW